MEDKLSAAYIAAELGSDLENGLSIEKAHERIHSRGRNFIHIPKTRRKFKGFCRQMLSVMNIILILMAAAHLFYNDVNGMFLSLCLIGCALGNGIVGYINFNRDSEIPYVSEIGKRNVRVVRSGIEKEINSQLLAQGDIILLKKGDIVPADAKIISCENLTVDESVVNGGEAATLKSETGDDIALYMGSKIIEGNVKAIVTNVGGNTLLGSALNSLKAEFGDKSVFAKRIEAIGNLCGGAAAVMWVLALVLRLLNGNGIVSAVDNSIAAAITAIPISLSAVLLITMSLDARRLKKNGVDVGSVSALEAMGGATVLCVGKRGIITEFGFKVEEVRPGKDFGENSLRLLGAMCTTVDMHRKELKGDPIQLALIADAKENGITEKDIRTKAPVCNVLDNRGSKGIMTTVHKTENGYTVITKGTPEAVLSCCSYIYDGGTRLLKPNEDIAKTISDAGAMTEKGMTVLGVSFKDVSDLNGDLLSGMTFAGLIGFANPLRSDTAAAIKQLGSMGVKTCIITDDKISSAETLAKACGIESVMHGGHTIKQGVTKLKKTSIFAETPVSSKATLVEMINSKRENAAVAGRSSKDVQAMGKGEVSVTTNESAGVCVSAAGVRIDGSGLGKIAAAIRECKRSFINNDRLIGFLLSCNIAEMICAVISLGMGYSIPFSPMAVLWLNVVVAAFGAVAIWREPYHRSGKERKGDLIRMKKGKLSASAGIGAVVKGAITGAVVMGMYAVMIENVTAEDRRFAVFAALCLSFMLTAQSCRSEEPLYKRMGKNKTAWLCIVIQLCFAALAIASGEVRTVLGLSQTAAAGTIAAGAAVGVIPFVLTEGCKMIFKQRKIKNER